MAKARVGSVKLRTFTFSMSYNSTSMSTMVLYMSFDKFFLAVESRELSQADKSIIRVSSFPKLSDGQQNFFFCLSTIEA
jgi:hypothetical protein